LELVFIFASKKNENNSNMGRAFEYRRASKEKRWGKMSKLFPRLAKTITMAVKEGGADPDLNFKLRTAIQNAKAENMPKDNIEAAIKRAAGKDGLNFEEIVYEGKGPHSVLIVVETATDNTTRTVANIKSIFNKFGGALVPPGSMEYMFARKAVFEFEKTENIDLDEMELELIDEGLEEIYLEDQTVYAYADYTMFGKLSNAFNEKKINITQATLQRFANNPVSFSEEQMADIQKFIDRIEDDDDVQAVYHNIA